MATAGGPKIVTDGLVFGYDTNYGVADNTTATRFYPGEPATNNSILAAYTWNGDGGNQSFANKGATVITDNSLKYNGYDTVLWTPGGSQNCYLNGTGDFNYSDGSTVWTFSCYVKREDGAAITSLNVYMYYPSGDGAAAGTIVDCGNGWYRVSRTRTGGTSAIQLGGFTGFSAGNKYYLSGVMLSKTNHTVPYVAVQSSRSSTASLIDLKKTTDIDVSNVSFDSTGQPTFDGTSDYIQNSSYTSHQQPTGTLEVVIKPTIVSGNRYVAGVGGTTTYGASRMIRINGGTLGIVTYGSSTQDWSGVTAATVNQYQHVVATWSGTSLQMYVNNVPYSATRTGVVSPLGTNITMGRPPWAAGSYYAGSVDIFKHYNKVLSAAEVQQNYNAYKKRFSI